MTPLDRRSTCALPMTRAREAPVAIQLNEQTSARVAALAGRGLTNPESLTIEEIKAVCASALAQAKEQHLPPIAKNAMGEMMIHEALKVL